MKNVIIICAVLFVSLTAIYIIGERKEGGFGQEGENFINCLKESGVHIYGSATCPYCVQLIQEYSSYNNFYDIYTDCNENYDKCVSEMLTNGVPEIQIKGELLQEWGSPEVLARETGCSM